MSYKVPCPCWLLTLNWCFLFYFKIFITYLAVPGLSCCRIFSWGMWDIIPRRPLPRGETLHWELGIWATGPPGKSSNPLNTLKGWWGLSRCLSGKEASCHCRRHGSDPWVGKIPWRRKWLSTPVFLPGEFHGQRSLAGYRPWGQKESDMT